jgi:uncharacterized protein (DUF983 family)
MFDDIITLSVEGQVDCPNCGETLTKGGIMYKDFYRDEILCSHCIEDWKEAIIEEEGEDGRMLKI